MSELHPAQNPTTIITKSVILLVSSLTILAGAIIAPSLPQMASEFNHIPNSIFLSKLILTLPSLSIALFAPFAGYLIDRTGRLKVLYPSLVLYAVAGSLGFFIENLYIILASRVVLGIAVAGILTTALTLVGDYFEGKNRDEFIGLQAAAMPLGGAVFVAVGGFLADIHWSYPFLIYLFSLLPLILGYLYLSEPEITTSPGLNIKPSSPFKAFTDIGLILGVAFLAMIIFYLLPVQIPFYLKEIGVVKNSSTGIAIAIATLASTVTGFFYARFREHFSIYHIFVLTFVIMGIGYGLIAFSTTFIYITLSMVVAGFGLGTLMPNLNTWLLQVAREEDRGKYSGWLSSFIFFGQFMSPLVASPVTNEIGLSYTFLAAGCFLILGALFFFIKSLSHRSPPPT